MPESQGLTPLAIDPRPVGAEDRRQHASELVRNLPAKVVGMFHDSEFMREVDEECLRTREAECEAARRGEAPE